MGGAASVVLGNLLNQIADTRNDELPQQDKEARMNLIESVVAGITAGTGNDATTASIASRLELENNQFALPHGVVKAGRPLRRSNPHRLSCSNGWAQTSANPHPSF